jgi:hypothetical protein
MSKTTMGTKLPRKLEQKMQTVGEQIKLARLRRNLSVAQVAERATCSPSEPLPSYCSPQYSCPFSLTCLPLPLEPCSTS